MPRLVGVQFRRAAAMVYDFAVGDLELAHDTRVVVETEKGEALGWTVGVPDARAPHISDGPVRRVLRVANVDDLAKDRVLHDREREALRHCAQRARQLGLPMKLVAVEWTHSSDKATFYFSSEERVDFRQLVRELAQRYRLRVEMRQVGPRDEAKIIGAMGPCGRETCCSSWMRAFTPVGIRMAKDQGLGLNPQKVTGVCGRLLCCLAYEQDTYKEMRKGLPKFGKMVVTPQGTGKVVDVLTLRRRVRVSIEGKWTDFDAADVRPVGAPQPDDDGDDDALEGDLPPAASPAEAKPSGQAPMASRPQRPNRPPQSSRPPQQGQGPRTDRPQGNRPPQQNQPPRGDRPQGQNPQPRPQQPPRPPRPDRPQNASPQRPDGAPNDPSAPQEQRSRHRRRHRGRGQGGNSNGGGGGAPPSGGGAPPTT